LGNYTLNPLEETNERRLYKGTENFLVYRNTYEMELHCDFELANYPFDRQYCSFVVNIKPTLFDN